MHFFHKLMIFWSPPKKHKKILFFPPLIPWTWDLLVSQKQQQKRHFFPTLDPLSLVIFATATVLAYVLLRDSRFNFHCYTQREATPTQKSARKSAATSRDFLRERLQSAFTLANQLRWIAQYIIRNLITVHIISETYYRAKILFLYIK